MTNSFNKTFYKLEKHYDSLFQIHGKNVGSSQQSSRSTQIKRMEMLTKNIVFKKKDKVLDFGCGTGFFFNFLKNKKKFSGYYHGCDISKKIIHFNKLNLRNSKVFFFL